MDDKKTTYSTIIIEMADYLFASTIEKMADLVLYFAEKCWKDKRTIQQLAKMQGWESVQKIDLDFSQPIIIQKN